MPSAPVQASGDFGRRLGKSIFWSFLDKWISRIFTLVVFVILGRLLTPSDFGAVALATSYVVFVTIFVDAGFGNALIQKAHLTKRDIGTAFSVSAVFGLALGGVSLLSAPAVADLFGSPQTAGVLRALSVSLFIQGLSSVPAALLEREMQFKALAIRRTSATFLSGTAAVVVALVGGGVWALVVQSLGFAVIGGVLVWVSTWRSMSIAFDLGSLRDLFNTSLGVLGIQFVTFVNSQADRLIVAIFLGVEPLGQYFFAMRIISLSIELFTAVFSNVGLSAFSKLQDDRPRLRALLYRLTSTTSLATVPVFAAIGAFASFFVPVVFGSQWLPAIPILQILIFLGALNSLLIFDRSVLIAVGRASTAFWLSVGQAGFGVALLLVAGPFGLVAVAAAVVVRQYVFWPVRMLVLRRIIQYRLTTYLAGWGTAMLGLVLAWGSAAAIMGTAPLWLAIIAFVLVYGLTYALLARRQVVDVVRIARRTVFERGRL
ncbi:PST family polysaccharide transporter [Frigoribacterium sp. PhB160]|uniref:lipopolysaccharide biosynthesis protein n=1 Tax=Frigoribacterium sp. PhB160 TaxID=2485192 RepID=UPI000F492D41|nr:lipopolysaccharide biosynthesis protein [Frigoribacterium sp. PhB160]ROS60967.1 PST family polysaccharide transporter [Frigoribacterium sp. PhB160]